MRRRACVALGASLLALAILPAGASATGTPESGGSGGNCSQTGAIVSANCTNISGPQVQVGGGLVNEQNQSSSQQNGDSSGTSNANTNAVAVDNSQPSYTGGSSEPSGSGGNCSQTGAAVSANCTNISGGQYQAGGGLVNQQNQSNNQQNGDNSGTSNANTNAVAVANSVPSDGYDGSSNDPSGSGGNCSQKATFIAANCTNISKGQEQTNGGEVYNLGGGGGSLVNQQNQSNNQQNGDNSGTSDENANVIAVGHEQSKQDGNENPESWSKDGKSESSGSGHNCTQSFAAFALNCTNYSGGQLQSNGDQIKWVTTYVPGGGGGSLVNQQNQSNNQQNGDNSGTSNENANVIAVGHGPSNGSDSWSEDGKSESSGSGGNCSQFFVAFSANCTNISKGQEQSNGSGALWASCVPGDCNEPGGGGSLVNQQNQSNNQQNGDNSGTHNYNANVIAVGGEPQKDGDWKDPPRDSGPNSPPRGGPSGSGGNCSQAFALFAANCTNWSEGQWQANGGGKELPCYPGDLCAESAPGGGGSLVNQQNQSNNQQNGDNSGTSNENANVIIVPGRRY